MADDTTSTDLGNCFTCPNREHTEWCTLGDDELQRIVDANKIREFLPGEALFHQGDPCHGVYCIHSGMVGIRKVDIDGNSVLLGLAHAGDTLGYRALLTGNEHKIGAEILKKGAVCFIHKGTVHGLIERNPALGHRFLGRAIKDLEEAEDKFLESVTLSVRARFAHLLLVLKDRYAKTAEGDKELVLELPLSRQDMAEMIGIRPETLSRTIRQFEEDGIAEFSGRTVRVPEISSLLDEFEGEEYL